MPEYIVDCSEVPYGEGLTLVLPISINGHVHERLIRRMDCKHLYEHDLSAYYGDHEHDHYSCCRLTEPGEISVELTGFCSWAIPRSGDG